MTHNLDQQNILASLDKCAEDCTFPFLDNANMVTFSQRLHLLRSATDWSLVIELDSVMPAAGTIDGGGRYLHLYGSNIKGEIGFGPGDFESLIACGTGEPFFADEDQYDAFVNTRSRTLRIRGVEVPVAHDLDWYREAGVEQRHPGRPMVIELLRVLAVRHKDVLKPPSSLLNSRLAPGMSIVLSLEEWRHPDLAGGEIPSAVESFRQFARVLETGDVGHYAPTEPPNTHLRHWPNAGCNTSWARHLS